MHKMFDGCHVCGCQVMFSCWCMHKRCLMEYLQGLNLRFGLLSHGLLLLTHLGSHVTCILVATNVICLVGASILWLLSPQLVSEQWLYQRRLNVFIVASVISTSAVAGLLEMMIFGLGKC